MQQPAAVTSDLLQAALTGLEMQRQRLQRDIIYRKKVGFPTPIRQWLTDSRIELVMAARRAPDGLLASYLNPAESHLLLKRHRAGGGVSLHRNRERRRRLVPRAEAAHTAV